jgi:RimJ/RimL family protein N-acetyltransferase
MIVGKNVTLRPLDPGDLDWLSSWWNTAEYLLDNPGRWPSRPMDLERELRKKPNFDKGGKFAIVSSDPTDAGEALPLGYIHFLVPTRQEALFCYEIGYSILPEHRGSGYATQAGRLMVDQLFNSTRVFRIQAHCLSSNDASRQVLEKIGMIREGTLRGLCFAAGQQLDVEMLSILRSEWVDTPSYAGRFGQL